VEMSVRPDWQAGFDEEIEALSTHGSKTSWNGRNLIQRIILQTPLEWEIDQASNVAGRLSSSNPRRCHAAPPPHSRSGRMRYRPSVKR
jgi:hypothetical protein